MKINQRQSQPTYRACSLQGSGLDIPQSVFKAVFKPRAQHTKFQVSKENKIFLNEKQFTSEQKKKIR